MPQNCESTQEYVTYFFIIILKSKIFSLSLSLSPCFILVSFSLFCLCILCSEVSPKGPHVKGLIPVHITIEMDYLRGELDQWGPLSSLPLLSASVCEVNRSPPTFAPTKGPEQPGQEIMDCNLLCMCVHGYGLYPYVCACSHLWVPTCQVSSSITLSLIHEFSLEPRAHCFRQPACSGHGLPPPPEHWACRLVPCWLGITSAGDLILRLL